VNCARRCLIWAAALSTGAFFQSVANHGAGTSEIVNLASDAPPPALPLGPRAGEVAQKIADAAERYPDKRSDGELDRDHWSTLRAYDNSAAQTLSSFNPLWNSH